MAIQGTLCESEYLAAQRLHLKPRPILAVVGVVLIIAALGAAYVDRSWWLILALAYLAAAFFVYMPFKQRRTFRQYKALSEAVTVEVRDEGLFFKRANGEGLVPWSHITKWRSNGKLLLLYPASNVFHLLPASFFPNQESFIKFVKLIEAKVGKAT